MNHFIKYWLATNIETNLPTVWRCVKCPWFKFQVCAASNICFQLGDHVKTELTRCIDDMGGVHSKFHPQKQSMRSKVNLQIKSRPRNCLTFYIYWWHVKFKWFTISQFTISGMCSMWRVRNKAFHNLQIKSKH